MGDMISELYNSFILGLPEGFRVFPLLIILTLGISAYSIIVWGFYKMLAKKDIIDLDISQYNNSKHSDVNKIGAIFSYILEFIIIYPLLITAWFFVFSVLLLVLIRGYQVQTILIISASVIAATRICAYYKEDLSMDLAKMVPFTLLCLAIMTPGFFDIGAILSRVQQIPNLLLPILYYIIFIFLVEVVFRIISLLDSFRE